MAVNITGLRPLNTESPTVKQKRGRVPTPQNPGRQVALNPSASPVSTYVRPQQGTVDTRFAQLIEALSSVAPNLAKLSMQQQDDKEKDQLAKLRFLTETFMKDKEIGAVDAAQVKKVLPETVPTVASRIAQATGEIEAKRWVQDKIQGILENDDLRLNTQSRNQAIAAIREEARGLVGNNPFYGTGFFSQLDRSLSEYEGGWMRETAAHQEKIQTENFAMHVEDALVNGGNLLELDKVWKASGSLNNIQRKEVVVNTAIDMAMRKGDPKILQQIPDRFLNAESKAKLQEASDRLETTMYSRFVRGKELEQYDRQRFIREGKVGILKRLVDGAPVNAHEYWQTPELYEYAESLQGKEAVDPALSAYHASQFESRMLAAGTTGGFLEAFKDDPNFVRRFRKNERVTEDGLRDYILGRGDIRKEDRVKLLDKLPTLMGGMNVLRHPDVENTYTNRIAPDLRAFSQTPMFQALQMRGINVQGEIRRLYDDFVQREVMAEIQETGQVPKGRVLNQILRDAEKDSLERLKYYQQHYKELITNPNAAKHLGKDQIDLGDGIIAKRVR